jgi:hypothetical protein
MSSLAVRLPACSLIVCLLAAGSVRAQDSKDVLKDEAQRKALEAQKVEKGVKESLENAALIAKTDPAEAAKLLKLVRDQVSEDTSLSAEQRKSLLAAIDARIKGGNERPSNPIPAERPAGTRPRDDGRAQDKEQFDRIAKVIEARNRSLNEDRELRDRRGDANLKADRDLVKSSVPPVNDDEFPRDWKERTGKRSEVKLTDKEIKLMKALNTPMRDLDLDKRNFKDVLQYLQDKTGQNIFVPKPIMDEVGISYETTISFPKLDNVTFRSVLKKILGDLNLTYIVKEGEIQVTTPERARQTYSTRAYYVGDLAMIADIRLGPIVQRALMAQQIVLIMNTIVQTVEPSSWQVNNPEAGGTITFDPITMSIIVKQSAEVHLMMGIGMRR